MKKVSIKLAKQVDDSYQVIVDSGIAAEIPKLLKKQKLGQKYAIITDSKVKKLYGVKLMSYLRKSGVECELLSFPQGEKSKHIETVEKLADQMIAKGFHRKDAVIALGGGVVGDIAGFLASIFMRGIPYIQIPTTLLAMVDSSVGGKTGVDLSGGKNLVGTFNQPKLVIVDPEYLKTLAKKQVRNGLAEIIKYGVIKDTKLFNLIEKNLAQILELEKSSITKIITESIKIKAEIVEQDEKEAGLRMILNYGHTYGHAIEKMSGYTLLHGHAISIGMVIANKIAIEKGMLSEQDADRIKTLLRQAGLPITTLKMPSMKDLLSDKKRIGDIINFILPTKIGHVEIIPTKCQ